MQWQPEEVKLNQICQLFVLASRADNSAQQQVMSALNQFSQMPDFILYLATIFARMAGQEEIIRQRAGLLLKTNVGPWSDQGRLTPPMLQHIQAASLEAVQDQSRVIRHTAGTVLATIVQKLGVMSSSQTLDTLAGYLKDSRPHVIEGSFSALNKVCEDLVTTLQQFCEAPKEHTDPIVNWCTQRFLPCVLEHATPAATVSARHNAVECLNHFALNGMFTDHWYPAFHPFAMKYVEVLGVLANDTDITVLRHICKGFVCTVDGNWSCLNMQYCQIVLQYMLKASRHAEYDVRAEALEIWTPCTRSPMMLQLVYPMLPELVPVLMANMVYSTADYMMMEQSIYQDDNANQPDEAQDIKPKFHKAKAEDESDDEDEQNQRSGGAWGAEWTARKAAASSLDNMSHAFSQEILPIVLPLIQQKLEDPNWEVQESGVLALGAIAYGCMEGLVQFLPKVMDLLLKLCAAPKPLLRSISCWTAARFSNWICHYQNPQREQVLKAVLSTLLQRVLDKNKRVQEAACSAFATLEEEARHGLVPYLNDIVATLVKAFQYYQAKNLLILYDAVGTLAECVNGELDRPAYGQALLQPIMQRFETVPDNDRSLVSLFECLGSLAHNIPTGMATLFPVIVQRCMRLIADGARAAQMWQQNPNEFEKPDREAMAASIDLLAGIIEGLQERVQEVLQQQNFIMVIPECLKDSSLQVKQSAFALVGDCARFCIGFLVPFLPQLLPAAAASLRQGTSPTVSNNASWAVGEVCVRVGPDFMAPYLDELVKALHAVLTKQHQQALLRRNVCITLGRLGMVCGHMMGNMYPEWGGIWCQTMRMARHDHEKENAFQGLCNWIKTNPTGCLTFVPQLVCSIISFETPPQTLAPSLKEILSGIKQNMGAAWTNMMGDLGPEVAKRLQAQYQL
eukprot:CAMPEP_0178457652 /NCGR_PEP_ID=MMETSP0689_2-20121128/47132_1 /TAXON_ID=160604 /ORGANISM="Amphidinium massartii, Strain CS-259" /LENGTH=907 /DNA_ID=CAMNT_0020083919 /DNA_START=41 /DNA_END=2764 /DNA_ORIENTATION=-